MTTIKLNRYYPYLTERITLEVSDEIAVVLSTGGCQCDSYKRRKTYRQPPKYFCFAPHAPSCWMGRIVSMIWA